MHLSTKQKQTHIHKDHICGYQEGEGIGEGKNKQIPGGGIWLGEGGVHCHDCHVFFFFFPNWGFLLPSGVRTFLIGV